MTLFMCSNAPIRRDHRRPDMSVSRSAAFRWPARANHAIEIAEAKSSARIEIAEATVKLRLRMPREERRRRAPHPSCRAPRAQQCRVRSGVDAPADRPCGLREQERGAAVCSGGGGVARRG